MLVFVLAILIAIGNVLHLQIKRIVRIAGYPVSLFFGHLRDIRYFLELIEQERDLEIKSRYKWILYRLSIVLISILIVFGSIVQNKQ